MRSDAGTYYRKLVDAGASVLSRTVNGLRRRKMLRRPIKRFNNCARLSPTSPLAKPTRLRLICQRCNKRLQRYRA